MILFISCYTLIECKDTYPPDYWNVGCDVGCKWLNKTINVNPNSSYTLFRILLHKRLKIKSEVNNINQSCVKSSASLKLSLTDNSGIESAQTKATQSSVSDGSHKKTKVCTLL